MSLHATLPAKSARVHAAEVELGGEPRCLQAEHMGATDPNIAHPCGHACGGSAFGSGSYCTVKPPGKILLHANMQEYGDHGTVRYRYCTALEGKAPRQNRSTWSARQSALLYAETTSRGTLIGYTEETTRNPLL